MSLLATVHPKNYKLDLHTFKIPNFFLHICEPLSKWIGVMLQTAKMDPKIAYFLATSENLNNPSLLQITLNPQLDTIESDFHAILFGKPCFTICVGIP